MSQSVSSLGKQIHEEAAYMTGRQAADELVKKNGPVMTGPTENGAYQGALSAYSYIPNQFALFEPPPAGPGNASIGTLRAVRDKLSRQVNTTNPGGGSDESTIQKKIATGLDRWEGNAKDNFETNFVDQIDEVAAHQAALAEILAATVEQHQKIRDSAHEDLVQIGNKALGALRGLPPGDHRHSGGGLSGNDELTVVLAIAGLALAIPTDGATAEAAFTIGGFSVRDLLNFGKTAAGSGQTIANLPHQKQATLGGSTVAEVISSMNDAIDLVYQWVAAQNQHISAGLAYVDTKIGRGRGMEMPKPRVATRADLAHETVDQLDEDYPGGFSPVTSS